MRCHCVLVNGNFRLTRGRTHAHIHTLVDVWGQQLLWQAQASSTSVVPVFVFDPRDFQQHGSQPYACGVSRIGTHRCGSLRLSATGPVLHRLTAHISRAHFLHDCVSDLRARLRELGSDLLVRWGHPERELRTVAQLVGAGNVFCHTGVTIEELHLQDRVRDALHAQGAELRCCWGGTLHAPDELPFERGYMPATFSAFKAAVEPCAVPHTLAAPVRVRRLPVGCPPCGDIPSVAQLCGQQQGSHVPTRGTRPARGGETEALRTLARVVARDARGLRTGTPVAALSPWLAMGCLSPRRVYHDIRQACQAQKSSAGGPGSTQDGAPPLHVTFELLWKDFFAHTNRCRSAARRSTDMTHSSRTPLTVTSVCCA